MANLNKAGGKTAAIKSKIKVAMRVLIPIFNESKNRFDETSTLQALETLQKIAEEPKGSLILSNMKMIEKLKIIIKQKLIIQVNFPKLQMIFREIQED
jgi:hypothetical protein